MDQSFPSSIEPIFASIQDTARALGLSQVQIYRLIAAEKLRAAKAGSKTLVEIESIHEFSRALPRFVGRTGVARKAA